MRIRTKIASGAIVAAWSAVAAVTSTGTARADDGVRHFILIVNKGGYVTTNEAWLRDPDGKRVYHWTDSTSAFHRKTLWWFVDRGAGADGWYLDVKITSFFSYADAYEDGPLKLNHDYCYIINAGGWGQFTGTEENGCTSA